MTIEKGRIACEVMAIAFYTFIRNLSEEEVIHLEDVEKLSGVFVAWKKKSQYAGTLGDIVDALQKLKKARVHEQSGRIIFAIKAGWCKKRQRANDISWEQQKTTHIGSQSNLFRATTQSRRETVEADKGGIRMGKDCFDNVNINPGTRVVHHLKLTNTNKKLGKVLTNIESI